MADEIRIADLVAELHASSDRFRRDLDRLRRKVDSDTDKMGRDFEQEIEGRGGKAFRNLRVVGSNAMSTLGRIARRVLIGGIVAGLGAMTAGIIKATTTSARFETLQLRLEQLAGSAEEGRRQFERLVTFSTSTPFRLQEIIEAQATLIAFGDTSQDTIRIMGDLAAFMGVTIPEAAAAYGRAFAAGAGAADIFRERGVLNIIKFSSGVEDLTKLTLPQFRAAMIQAFTDPSGRIAGGTEKLAGTLEGRWSTAQDKLDIIWKRIGDQFRGQLLSLLDDLIAKFDDFVNSGKAEQFGQAIVRGMNLAIAAAEKLSNLIAKIGDAFPDTSTPEGATRRFQQLQQQRQNLLQLISDEGHDPQGLLLSARGRQLFAALKAVEAEIKTVLSNIPTGPPVPEGFQSPGANQRVSGGSGASGQVNFGLQVDGQGEQAAAARLGQGMAFVEQGMQRLQFSEQLEERLKNTTTAAQKLGQALEADAAALGAMIRNGASFEQIALRLAAIAAFTFIPGFAGQLIGGFLGAQHGADFTVPSGFSEPNNPLLLGVSAGERVQVTPAGSGGGESRILSQIHSAVVAQTATMVQLRKRQDVIEASISASDRSLDLMVRKSQKRDAITR